jgi:hypothetical protein
MQYPKVKVGNRKPNNIYPVNIQTGKDTFFGLTYVRIYRDSNSYFAEWEGHRLPVNSESWPAEIKALIS